MTSIPVNNAKSVMMDFTAKTPGKTQNAGETGSFTDVLRGQTEGSRPKTQAEKAETEPLTKTQAKVNQSARNRMRQEGTSGIENADAGSNEKAADALEKAGMETARRIADELGISEEDVLRAMEVLGLTAMELLQPENLTAVVLQASGESDPMALITNAGLSDALKNLNQFVSDIRNELQAAFHISDEQLGELLNQVQEQNEPEEIPAAVNDEADGLTNGPQIVVEDFTGGKEPEQLQERNATNEEPLNPAALKDGITVTKEQPAGDTGKETEQETKGEHGAQNQAPVLQNPEQSAQIRGAGQAETVPFAMQQTREIMNQILDYMKIQIKPEMTQLEMQLHPESLGNVNVHIASREGVITAQFTAQNETVRAALESQIVQLRETFAEQGVKVDAIEVSVQANGFRQEYEGSRERGDTAEDDRKKAVRRIHLGNPELLAEEALSEEEQLTVSMMEANGNTVDYTA